MLCFRVTITNQAKNKIIIYIYQIDAKLANDEWCNLTDFIHIQNLHLLHKPSKCIFTHGL